MNFVNAESREESMNVIMTLLKRECEDYRESKHKIKYEEIADLENRDST